MRWNGLNHLVWRTVQSLCCVAQPFDALKDSMLRPEIRGGPLVGSCSELWNRYRFGIGTSHDYIAAAEWMLGRTSSGYSKSG